MKVLEENMGIFKNNKGCPTFWHFWVTLEEELSWAIH